MNPYAIRISSLRRDFGPIHTTIAIGAGLIVALLDVALILAAMARFKRARLILD